VVSQSRLLRLPFLLLPPSPTPLVVCPYKENLDSMIQLHGALCHLDPTSPTILIQVTNTPSLPLRSFKLDGFTTLIRFFLERDSPSLRCSLHAFPDVQDTLPPKALSWWPLYFHASMLRCLPVPFIRRKPSLIYRPPPIPFPSFFSFPPPQERCPLRISFP